MVVSLDGMGYLYLLVIIQFIKKRLHCNLTSSYSFLVNYIVLLLLQFKESLRTHGNVILVRNYLLVKQALNNGSRIGMICNAKVQRASNASENAVGEFFYGMLRYNAHPFIVLSYLHYCALANKERVL